MRDMNRHPIRFENLSDYVDSRLSPEMRETVEAHLSTGCPVCQEQLAWLQRVIRAARSDDTAEPPRQVIARAKALYRVRVRRSATTRRRLRLSWVPRLALTAALVVVISVGFYASQIPTLFVRHATLTALTGTVERQAPHDTEWQVLDQGARLGEGHQVRVLDGEAVLTLFDGTTLDMLPGTELAFSSLRSGLFRATVWIAIDQRAGSVQYDVVPLRSERSLFAAESPTVSVTVCGTRFVLTVESVEQSKVTVLEGTVRVVSPVETAVLTEREVIIAPAAAPLVRLPTLTPTAVPEPETTDQPLPSATSTSTPSPVTPALTPRGEETAHPAPTAKPSTTPHRTRTLTPPSAELAPTATYTRGPALAATIGLEKVDFVGTIEAFPNSLIGRWIISGREVHVSRHTEIVGKPAVGLPAKVRAWGYAQRPLQAVSIHIDNTRPAATAEPVRTPTATQTFDPPQVVKTILPTRTLHPTRTADWTDMRTRTPTKHNGQTPGANKNRSSTATSTPTIPPST